MFPAHTRLRCLDAEAGGPTTGLLQPFLGLSQAHARSRCLDAEAGTPTELLQFVLACLTHMPHRAAYVQKLEHLQLASFINKQ